MNKYRIEQINVSDSDYKLTQLYKKPGGQVLSGDVLFTYESSKADFDCCAMQDGFVYYRPLAAKGAVLKTGDIVAIITPEILTPEQVHAAFTEESVPANIPSGERIITRKAKQLIEANNLDVSMITGYEIINEEVVESYLKNADKAASFQNIEFYYTSAYKKHFGHGLKRLAVIGAGKAALQVYDTVLAAQKHNIVFLYDNNVHLVGQSLMGIPVKGVIDYGQIKKDYEDNLFDEIIVSFSGDIDSRKKTFIEIASLDLPLANVIHPSCIMSNFFNIGVGNILFANVRIGPFVSIGNNNVISSLCSFEHHNTLGDHNTFGPAVITSGSCTLGESCKFGTGIYIEPKINIGNGCIISSGVVIRQNIPSNSVVRNLNRVEIKPLSN